MKLDPTVMRTMSGQDFRVLEAVEKGMSKHSLVPSPLIASLASLRHGGTGKILSGLLRDKLLSHDRSCGYDGYRLTNAGYDILALHTLKTQRKVIAAIGDKIGTGKESDVYLAVHPNGQQVVLKFHRLGRTSFRNVKKKRDYFMYNGKNAFKGESAASQQQSNSWLFLSRKSALKEYAFMKALYDVDYPTPEPLAHNRHIVAMSLVRGVPLYQIRSSQLSSEQAASIFHQASALAVRLAKHGLVHCDLNEFNLLVDLSGIQQQATSQEHDPYVRHSGLSVAAESAPGMLSARGPWEPERLQQFQQNDQNDQNDQGSIIDEPPKPIQLLDNGEAKPMVVLIDFPQMVSTLHPNAAELYERDTACLYKFFSHKLQFQIPDADRGSLYLTWESVQDELLQQQKYNNNNNNTQSAAVEFDNNDTDVETTNDNNNNNNDTESICLANRAQLRLDQQLKASGYSDQDANRDSELYYYFNQDKLEEQTNGQEEEDNDDDDDDDDGSLESIEEEDQDNDGTGTLAQQQQEAMDAFSTEQLAEMSMRPLQEQARLRVKQQLEMQKKKGKQRGAFRKRNSSKAYEKGKRVYQDIGM